MISYGFILLLGIEMLSNYDMLQSLIWPYLYIFFALTVSVIYPLCFSHSNGNMTCLLCFIRLHGQVAVIEHIHLPGQSCSQIKYGLQLYSF
jgi:hypothetical protein